MPLSTKETPLKASTQSRLKAAFNAQDPFLEITTDPKLRVPIVHFDAGQRVKKVPTDIYDNTKNTLPFPNTRHPGRRPILKNKVMSNCASFYDCLNHSNVADAITMNNTVVNAGGALNVIRARNAREIGHGQAQDQPKPEVLTRLSTEQIISIPHRIKILDRVGHGNIGPSPDHTHTAIAALSAAPYPVKHPSADAGHLPNVALVEHAGRVEHPEKPTTRPKPSKSDDDEDFIKANERKVLTLAMLNKNGRTKFMRRSSAFLNAEPAQPAAAEVPKSSEQQEYSILQEYHKIDFDHVDASKLYKYAMALAYQEMQYRIPIRRHAKKMRDYESRADQELSRIHNLINPPNQPRHFRRMSDSSVDPFEIKKYTAKLHKNAVTNPKSLLNKFRPDPSTVTMVNSWLGKNPKKVSTTVWLQPILAKLEEKIEEKVFVKKFFNILDGRVRFPFFDPTVYNSFAKRNSNIATTMKELMGKKLGPYDKFRVTFPLGGFQNNEISFEYRKNVIYITAKTLRRYAKKKNIRRVEESVEIPERLTITDLEYSRDRQGNLTIEELPDGEKQRMKEANHLYATSSQSIHQIFS